MIDWAARAGKEQVAALAPLVLRHAEGGDEAAIALRDEAASALAEHVRVLYERLGPWRTAPELALAGGLARPGGPLRAAIRDALDRNGLACRLHERTIDAARGATRLARVPLRA
jgi:N-acetylglucosamine kinase-like BadF-type ATPase